MYSLELMRTYVVVTKVECGGVVGQSFGHRREVVAVTVDFDVRQELSSLVDEVRVRHDHVVQRTVARSRALRLHHLNTHCVLHGILYIVNIIGLVIAY